MLQFTIIAESPLLCCGKLYLMSGNWGVTSPISNMSSSDSELCDNKPGILCWLIITNKTQQQFSQPRPHHSSSPRLCCPASSWKQRNEFIIHQKGSEQLYGEHQHRDQHLPGVCSPPSMGPALLTTASNRPCLFLTTLDHSGQRFNMHPVAVSLNTDRIIKQQTSFN